MIPKTFQKEKGENDLMRKESKETKMSRKMKKYKGEGGKWKSENNNDTTFFLMVDFSLYRGGINQSDIGTNCIRRFLNCFYGIWIYSFR